MSELVLRENWQLNNPAHIQQNEDGSVTFRGPTGDIFLPEDYLRFMQKSEGAALRDRGSWFMGHFAEGVVLFEIEWLGKMRNVMLSTWGYYGEEDEAKHLLPQKYVFIGYAEPGPSDVIMNVLPDDPDYGKVYVWTPARDPWMTGDNTRGLGFVANSFTEFMNNLAPKEAL